MHAQDEAHAECHAAAGPSCLGQRSPLKGVLARSARGSPSTSRHAAPRPQSQGWRVQRQELAGADISIFQQAALFCGHSGQLPGNLLDRSAGKVLDLGEGTRYNKLPKTSENF